MAKRATDTGTPTTTWLDLAAKLSARALLRGPKYVMFNNIYSKQDALRFLQREHQS